MRGGVAKQRRAHRSRLNFPKLSQEKLLDADGSEGAEHPLSHSEQSLVSGDLAQETTSLQSKKRQFDAISEINPLPAKRVRSTRTDMKRPGVADEKVEQVDGYDNPQPPKRLYVSTFEPKVERPERVSPATRLWKRRISGDDNEHQLKRARLTRENLTLFNKMARKKGTNKASASAPPESTVQSSTAKTTSTTSSGFAMQAYENGILEPGYSKPPENLEDIRE